LLFFPFLNPPQNHPLYGTRIPRHHSRFLANGASPNMTSTLPFMYEPRQLLLSYPYTEISTYPSNPDLEGHACSDRNNPCVFPHECVNGHCSIISEGDYCINNPDCGFWRSCIHGRCTTPHFSGESCHSHSECYSYQCTRGVCTGTKLGKSCNPRSPNECDEGLYCSLSSKKCKPQRSVGDDGCRDVADYSNYLSVCSGFSMCNTATDKCTEILSLDEGELCGDVLNCGLELDCRNGVCAKQSAANSTNFTFRDRQQDSHPCQEEVDLWISCADSNGCVARHVYDWNGCMAESCSDLQRDLQKCLSHGAVSQIIDEAEDR